jgi:maleylpyruvate isomerase
MEVAVRGQATLLAWQEEGTERILAEVAALPDERFAEPSALPGWSRAHLVAHLARNADALVNLLTWARTGTATPMYARPGQRGEDIEAGARQAPAELRADLVAACRSLAEATAAVPAEAWQARVLSAQGRDIPAAEVPWLRVREVWVHLVDLDTGVPFSALPAGLVAALLDDITAGLGRRGPAQGVELVATDLPGGRWAVPGPPDEPVCTVSGPAADLLRWTAGRGHADPGRLTAIPALPLLPTWL